MNKMTETDTHKKARKTKTSAAVKNRYNKKNYDTIIICPKKGEKAKIKAAAEKRRESMNSYILRLIYEDMGDS